MKKRLFFTLTFLLSLSTFAQNKDSILISKIFTEALGNGKSYQWLEYLCKHIGHRLSGSPQAAAAVEYTRQLMDSVGLDTVYLQEVMVPHWVRGEKETAKIINSKQIGEQKVRICALGGSVGTIPEGITAPVVEVKSFDELAKMGKARIQGKIVFFNRPMDPTLVLPFEAYGKAVEQRGRGAIEAAKYGAVGVIVRSMTVNIDEFPHTGMMRYQDGVNKIPAAAIATIDAELLSRLLKNDPLLKFHFRMNCKTLPDVKSFNVIGELRGTEKPDEIILVGGHLDSWDLGEGAHDDGAGCVQSIEVLRLLKAIGYKPKRTLRAVMFMNEENGVRGARKYAETAKQKSEKHIAAIESDAGGFTPRGFSIQGTDEQVIKLQRFRENLKLYGAGDIGPGHAGTDVEPLQEQGAATMSFRPDPQRYFDFHHTEQDRFEFVNKRELEMGGAVMAALVYLIAEHGL